MRLHKLDPKAEGGSQEFIAHALEDLDLATGGVRDILRQQRGPKKDALHAASFATTMIPCSIVWLTSYRTMLTLTCIGPKDRNGDATLRPTF